jgi:tRNA-Thr(GGU) m(6)t(6)A37 methyltransferase TsaA
MNWDALAAVAELIGALGVIVTVAYLALQIRQNSKLVASSLAESTRDALNETTRILASDREAARIFWSGIEDRSSLTDQERQQFDALLTLTFLGQRQAFVQGQIEEASDFQWTLQFPGVRAWWATYSPIFPGAFRDYVDRALEEGPRGRPADFRVRAIGVVRSPVADAVDLDWGSVESRIVLEPEHRPGLRGLEEFSHVVVVALLHGASFDPARHLVRRPRGLAEMPELGIFAQRAKDRPNPIGLTVVPLVSVEPDGIVVRGLDAIDGTPILDLKPHFPAFDAPERARVPEWVERLMRGYF